MNQPMLKADEIIKCLSRNGFSIVRQKGSHVRMRHNDGRVTSAYTTSYQLLIKSLISPPKTSSERLPMPALISAGVKYPANQSHGNLLELCIAVGMPVTRHPPHRSVREELPHTAPTSGLNNAKPLVWIRCADHRRSFQNSPLVTVLSSRASAADRVLPALFGPFFGTMLVSDFSTAYMLGLWSQTFPNRSGMDIMDAGDL